MPCWSWPDWLDNEVVELLDLSDGFVGFVKLVVDEERDKLRRNRDLERGGVGEGSDGGPGNLYSPVSGSAIGAANASVCKGKLADATKSFPDSLSLSITVK